MQFALFLAVLILFGSVWYSKKESLSLRMKLGMVGIVIILIALAAGYEMRQSQMNEYNRMIISAFKQGKTLYCGDSGVEVNSTTFIFVSGTLSFIPSDENKKDQGMVIDTFTCKTKH